jgi:hypothetical protein
MNKAKQILSITISDLKTTEYLHFASEHQTGILFGGTTAILSRN